MLLNSAVSPLALDVQCRDANGHEMSSPAIHRVYCTFKIDRGRLELNTAGAFADITLTLRVVVSESSPDVMKSFYPERSLFTTLRAENLSIEWDTKYQADFRACWKILSDFNTRFQEQIDVRDPRPPWERQIGVRELIRDLAERDHRSAYAVAAAVARRAGVPTEDVLEDVFRSVEDERSLRRGRGLTERRRGRLE